MAAAATHPRGAPLGLRAATQKGTDTGSNHCRISLGLHQATRKTRTPQADQGIVKGSILDTQLNRCAQADLTGCRLPRGGNPTDRRVGPAQWKQREKGRSMPQSSDQKKNRHQNDHAENLVHGSQGKSCGSRVRARQTTDQNRDQQRRDFKDVESMAW